MQEPEPCLVGVCLLAPGPRAWQSEVCFISSWFPVSRFTYAPAKEKTCSGSTDSMPQHVAGSGAVKTRIGLDFGEQRQVPGQSPGWAVVAIVGSYSMDA